jgi:transposase-like protein
MRSLRFPLSLKNVDHLLFEQGIALFHETARFWWNRFGLMLSGTIEALLRVTPEKLLLHITVMSNNNIVGLQLSLVSLACARLL